MGFKPEEIAAAASQAISKLKANGQIGYGEIKTITYDGTGEKVDLGVGAAYAKIQDQPIDLSKATKITIWQYEEGYTTIEGFEVQSQSGMQAIMKPGVMNDYIMVLSVSDNEMGVPEGLYFADGTSIYISSLEYGTLHTIDPKYLPGLTLPVFELSEATATAMMGGGEPTLTDEEAAKLDSLLLTYAPFMLTAKMQGAVAGACMCQYALDFSSFMPTYAGCMYYYAEGGINLSGFRFKKTESGWIARMISGIAYQR